jgi:hypothetical protein
MRTYPFVAALVLSLAACDPTGTVTDEEAGPSLAILGGGKHDMKSVKVEEILTRDDGLREPRDLKVHPDDDEQLWIVNAGNDSMTIVFSPGTSGQVVSHRAAPGNNHFMPKPSALAFGDETMATIHDMNLPTQAGTPADFMGPTLWYRDERDFQGGAADHLDMLHNTPLGMGIAWEVGNAFWVFDGTHSALTRYDFVEDHGPGMHDHSDGIISRCVEGQVKMVAGVSSHLELDHETRLLYVADTGNNRLAVLDIDSGERGGFIQPNYDGADQHRINNAALETFADGDDFYMGRPSGLALYDGHVYVADHQTGEIQAFTLEGEAVDYLETGIKNSLQGISFDKAGRLYVVDTTGERVLRISAKK